MSKPTLFIRIDKDNDTSVKISGGMPIANVCLLNKRTGIQSFQHLGATGQALKVYLAEIFQAIDRGELSGERPSTEVGKSLKWYPYPFIDGLCKNCQHFDCEFATLLKD